MLELADLFLLGLAIGLILYLCLTRNLKHFKRKGIPYLPGYPLIGNNGPNFLRIISPLDHLRFLYNELKGHRLGGMFQFNTPVVLVRDPELIKMILVKDFDHFTDRSIDIPEEADAFFGGSVFGSQGHKWRALRSTLSPAFTSSKIKLIFRLVSEIGQQMVDHIHRQQQDSGNQVLALEATDLWARFTTDVIATAGFGIHCDSFENPENEFYSIGRLITDFSGWQGFIFLGFLVNWRLMKLLGFSNTRPKVKKFLSALVKETISTREREGIKRPDIIHLLMMARKGELTDEETTPISTKKIELDDTALAAQVWNFFFAGVETTATLLAFATNRLAVFPEVQRKLQAEIDSVLEEEAELTYEAILRMKYLDMVLSETLRLVPPVAVIDRKCVKSYHIPAAGTEPGLVLEPGEAVHVNVVGLHMDSEHFPDPEKFEPERFSDENKQNITPFTYLPFGVGPRNCIGMRLALMEAKVALCYLLSKFDLKVIDKTPLNIEFSKSQLKITVDGGLWVGVSPRVK